MSSKTKSAKPVPNWQIVENVATVLERFYVRDQEAKVTQKVMLPLDSDPTRTREVDILVEVQIGRRNVRIGVDVKNEGRPLDSTKVEQLVAKRNKLKKTLDKYCVVSTSGFSAGARTDADGEGIDLLTLEILKSQGQDEWKFGLLHTQYRLKDTRWSFADLPDDVADQVRAFSGDCDAIEVVKDGDATTLNDEARIAGGALVDRFPIFGAPPEFELELDPVALGWSAVHFGSEDIPLPRKLVFSYETRVAPRDAEISRYSDNDGNIATAATYWHQDVQIQVTAVVREEPDGRRSVMFSTEPAKRKQTKVPKE